jgi:hypothetical protein
MTTSETEGSLLTEAQSITWTFPVSNSMITIYDVNYSIPYPDKENQ